MARIDEQTRMILSIMTFLELTRHNRDSRSVTEHYNAKPSVRWRGCYWVGLGHCQDVITIYGMAFLCVGCYCVSLPSTEPQDRSWGLLEQQGCGLVRTGSERSSTVSAHITLYILMTDG